MILLWTDRIIRKQQNKRTDKENKIKLKKAVQMLELTLNENIPRLETLIQTINNQKVAFDPSLDVSVWNVVKNELISHLRDATIQKRTAYHFSKLNSLMRLNSRLLELITGINSAINGTKATKNSLMTTIVREGSFLKKDTEEIIKLLNEELKNI